MDEYKFCPVCGSGLVTAMAGGIERKKCGSDSCAFILWDNPVPVVAAIIEYKGNLLFARNALWPKKIFAPVAGFLEKNETPEEAARREVKEELGLETVKSSLVGLYPFSRKNQIIIAYYMVCEGTITLNEEIAETKIIPFDKVKTWPYGTGPAVRDALISRGFNPDQPQE